MSSIRRSVFSVFVGIAVAALAICRLTVSRPSERWNELEEIISLSNVDVIAHRKSLLGDRSEKWIVKINPEFSEEIIANCGRFGENLATDRNNKGWLDEMHGLAGEMIANGFETPFFVAGIFFYSSKSRGPFVDVVISESMEYVYFHLWDI